MESEGTVLLKNRHFSCHTFSINQKGLNHAKYLNVKQGISFEFLIHKALLTIALFNIVRDMKQFEAQF